MFPTEIAETIFRFICKFLKIKQQQENTKPQGKFKSPPIKQISQNQLRILAAEAGN